MTTVEEIRSLTDLIAFYEAIPEEKWTTDYYIDENNCRCAIGHLRPDVVFSDDLDFEKEEKWISKITGEHVGHLVSANDRINPKYPQLSPKQRVLACLNDLKNES